MKKLINGMAMAATAITGLTVATAPATAQSPTYAERHYGTPPYNYDSAMRDYRRELRNYRRWNRYDYNNPDPRYGAYYADRYYRDGRYYRQRQLSYDDRVYRGYDNRYYCRRSDGTTGLIIGAGAGALAGAALSSGRSEVLGVLLGAAVGGAIGTSVDRDSRPNYYCR
ncbi:MAG TPA: glycine zipper 2TM domain-containing protein [Sphingomonas sp.]|nr:glycine zipper 2TM domain-containing protein [Sphingomonas sp.]